MNIMEDKQYDILIVGCGISGASIAAQFPDKRILIMERDEIGGMCRTENHNGIEVHMNGRHVFHTDNHEVWEFVNRYATFNGYIHRTKSVVDGQILSFPINLNTYQHLYQIDTPDMAKELINTPTEDSFTDYEDYLIQKVGPDLYDKFYKGYTEKFWGMPARNMPMFMARRIPVRSSFTDQYYTSRYQGVPIEGYTAMIEKMTAHCDIMNIDFLSDKEYYESLADVVVYTGSVDEYFDFTLGNLPYRSCEYMMSIEPVEDFQGIAQMNYCDADVPYTRIIEHKHFNWIDGIKTTVTTTEYPKKFVRGKGLKRFYPIPLEDNESLYNEYISLDHKAYFAGRLGRYRYMNMDECIEESMWLAEVIKEDLDDN